MLLLIFNIVTLVSCKSSDEEETPDDKTPEVEIKCTTDSYPILEGGIYETMVYTFESNVPGPRLFIMGGTHGDEIAGWKAALELVKKTDWHGSVMLIPQCNILADTLNQRYAGANNGGVYNGVTYKDLNRNFPGSPTGDATQKIAAAIIAEVIKFNPTYAIDLHESRSSASEGRVGETLIYSNPKSALLADEIVTSFNRQYIKGYEKNFSTDSNPPAGSFNGYCGTTLKVHAFTIETNRTLDIDRRIEQQLQLLNILFDQIWN